MQLPKSLFIFIGLILLTKLSIGQSNIDINHRSNGYGLSYRWVYDITQDEMGFIWMANHTGLRRYDGSEYVTYQHEDGNPKSLSVNTLLK